MKKVVRITLIFIVLLFCNITVANAATKEELIAYTKKSFNINGTSVSLKDADKAQVERLLRQSEVTEAQADEIIAKIDAGVNLMRAENITDPHKLPAAKKQELLSLGQQAASIAGYEIVPQGNGAISVFKDGTKVAEVTTTSGLTQAGNSKDYSYIVYAIASVAVIAIAGFVVYTKKNKVNA